MLQRDGCESAGEVVPLVGGYRWKPTKEARPLWWSTFYQLHERTVAHCVLNYDLDKSEKFEKF